MRGIFGKESPNYHFYNTNDVLLKNQKSELKSIYSGH